MDLSCSGTLGGISPSFLDKEKKTTVRPRKYVTDEERKKAKAETLRKSRSRQSEELRNEFRRKNREYRRQARAAKKEKMLINTICEKKDYLTLSGFVMSAIEEQRCNIKFCVKLGETFAQTFKMLQIAYGSEVLSRSRSYEWYKRFKEGRESVEDDPRSGRRSSTLNDKGQKAQLNELLRSNRRFTIQEIAAACNISFGTCQKILAEMRCASEQLAPRLITDEQNPDRVEVVEVNLGTTNYDGTSLQNIRTDDEVPHMVDSSHITTVHIKEEWVEPENEEES